jgi:hypothetical protein
MCFSIQIYVFWCLSWRSAVLSAIFNKINHAHHINHINHSKKKVPALTFQDRGSRL